jgi:hypothetical protein
MVPGPPDAAEYALSAQLVAHSRRSTATRAAAAPSCSAAWKQLHDMLERGKLLGMVRGPTSAAAVRPEMRLVLSMSRAPHGCRIEPYGLHSTQLLASRGVRMAADPWPEGGVY